MGGPTPSSDVAVANKIKLASVFSRASGGRVFGTSTIRANGKLNNPNEDHTNVLIAHAAMHAFAVRFEVAKLKALSLTKLNDKLGRMELHANRIGDVTALVRWIYRAEVYVQRDMSELRDLVARYVVSEVAVMGDTEEFQKLLEEGGLFVKDFWVLIYSTLL